MDLEIGSDPVPRPVPIVEPLLEEELPGVVKLTLKMQENAWRHIAYCLVARSKTDMTNSPKKNCSEANCLVARSTEESRVPSGAFTRASSIAPCCWKVQLTLFILHSCTLLMVIGASGKMMQKAPARHLCSAQSSPQLGFRSGTFALHRSYRPDTVLQSPP